MLITVILNTVIILCYRSSNIERRKIMADTTVNISNNTQDEPSYDEPWSLEIKIIVGIIFGLLIVFTILGNVLTIASFVRDKKLRTTHNYFIVNLAVTDLLIGAISMPWYSAYTLMDSTWVFGRISCKILNVCDFTLCLETILVLVLISNDTFALLKYGVSYAHKQTTQRALMQIAASWVAAFALYGPAIIGWNFWVGHRSVEENDCDTEFYANFPYTFTTAVLEFGVPFIAVTVLNCLIYKKIKEINLKKQKGKNQIFAIRTETNATSSVAQTRGTESLDMDRNSKEMVIKRRQQKVTRSLMKLVIVFAICWAPYTINTIIISLMDTSQVNYDVALFLDWLLWSKSCIDPFLYAFGSLRFRENFKRILRIKSQNTDTNLEFST